MTERARELIERGKLVGGGQRLSRPAKSAKRLRTALTATARAARAEGDKPTVKKRKGPKQPNPLSIKKKKTPTTMARKAVSDAKQEGEATAGKKRRPAAPW